MPKNSPVHELYEALKGEGMDKGKAAAIAQSRTGLSLKSGMPPKKPHTMAMIIAVKRNKAKKKK